jgi:DNA-binding NarL/FixJ family response regulator
MAEIEKSGIWVHAPQGSAHGRRTPGGTIKVLIVDDHAAYRQGLRSTFELEPDIEVVGEAENGSDAIEQAELLKPDVVLMDVNMPGMNGMEVTRKLTDAHPGMCIVILTMFKNIEHLREARRAGASAYVMKDAGSGLLLQTVRDVVRGHHPLLQRDTQPLEDVPPAAVLPSEAPTQQPSLGTDKLVTFNERTILVLLAQGLTNDQIAARIGLNEGMVRTYLAEIYRKLGLSGRQDAIDYARERGIIE